MEYETTFSHFHFQQNEFSGIFVKKIEKFGKRL